MQFLYGLCGLSKQAHHQAMEREDLLQDKHILYVALMTEIRAIHPGMGLRTMYELAQPVGIGRDGFIMLGLLHGFRLQIVSNPTRTTFSIPSRRYANLLADREFTDVNQIWTSDITYFFYQGKHYYIVLIMDVYSRRIVGWSMADNMRAENNCRALDKALSMRGIKNYQQKLIHHSDRGAQYTSDAYTEQLQDKGILISMCRGVYENTHIERANGTIKNQYMRRYDIPNVAALSTFLDKTINAYNEYRPHQSLNGMSPVQFEKNLKELKIEDKYILKIFTESKQFGEKTNQIQLQLEL